MNELDSLLRAAGRMMLDSQSPKVFSKGHHADFVTEADIAVQSYLVDALQRAYPHAKFLAEEEDRHVLTDALTFIIDPIDGTTNYFRRRLSGRRHTVVSGVTLRTAGRMHTFSAESGVWFRPLSEEEIGYYLDTFAPYDKAGSYGIQEWIGYAAIEKINGSFYNVMGLPIQKVYVELEKFLQ